MQIRPAVPTLRRTLKTYLPAIALFGVAAVLVPATPAAADAKPAPELIVRSMQTDILNPAVGETFYTYIDVKNYGDGDSDDVTVTVAVPPELRPEPPQDEIWSCSTATSGWTCTHPPLRAGYASRLPVPATVVGGEPGSHPG